MRPSAMSPLAGHRGGLGDLAGQLGADALATAKKTGELLKDAGKEAGAAIKGLFQSLEQKAKK